jgi:hypothetical protein
MREKNLEILLYDNKKLEGTAYCRKHNMKCKVKIENKSEGIVLTYRIHQKRHFYTNLASGRCKNCYYFNIELEPNNNCKIEASYYFGRENRLRLIPVYKDDEGRINYLKPIEVKVKKEKIEYEKRKK